MATEQKSRGCFLKTVLLFFISLTVSLLVAEIILIIIFGPITKSVSHPALDTVILPNSGEHDEWGFRNREVPPKADIVVIGDSQTYGLNASMENAWPKVLGNISGKYVYNLSVCGYSPAQYHYLLNNYAVKLNPKLVIVAIYLGNDLVDVFDLVYSLDYWAYLRSPDIQMKPVRKKKIAGKMVFIDAFKDGLWQNSKMFQLMLYTSANLKEKLRYIAYKYDLKESRGITYFKDESSGYETALNPGCCSSALNLKDPRIRDGLRITMQLLSEMKQTCASKGIDLLVVFIPSKEAVHSEFIESHPDLHFAADLKEVLENESKVIEDMRICFDQHDIQSFDLTDYLKEQLKVRNIYKKDSDDHFTPEGYAAIASAVYEYINTQFTN